MFVVLGQAGSRSAEFRTINNCQEMPNDRSSPENSAHRGSMANTTNYLYDGPNLIEELDNSGNVFARYIQTRSVDEELSEFRSGTTSYYQADGLGTVTSLSGSGGALANTYAYDSFGRLTASAGTLTNPFQYTGREFDAEAGIYHYRARYYDQNVGRFINEDPIGFSGGFNFYAYVDGNPIVYRDPFGRTSIPTVFWGYWCGPNWTGNHFESYDPAHDTHGYYHEPFDATDQVCRDHDICYYVCRRDYPCDSGARRRCMRDICDARLILNAPKTGAGPWIAFGIDIFNGSPDAGEDVRDCPGCRLRHTGGHK